LIKPEGAGENKAQTSSSNFKEPASLNDRAFGRINAAFRQASERCIYAAAKNLSRAHSKRDGFGD